MASKESSDYGTPESAQHAPRRQEQTERAGVTRLRVLDQIDIWLESGKIDQALATAADSFRKDIMDAGMMITCEKREKVDGSSRPEPSERYRVAQANIRGIQDACGLTEYNCLYYVVGMGMTCLEASQSRHSLPRAPRTIRKHTINALEIAARFYRLAT